MTDRQVETIEDGDDIRAPESGTEPNRPSVAKGLLNPHFIIAAVILAVTAGGWGLAVSSLKLFTEKYAVPWPAGVEVGEEFVMTSMPDRMGPFEFVSADGELDFDTKTGEFHTDGLPDGEVELREDVMELLGIGTSTDETNLPLRKSNWLSVRTYRDNRRPPGDPLRYWNLEVYYYTGGVDLVPHVPEICAVAGGAIHVGTTDMPIHVDGPEGPWSGQVRFQRALFERSGMSGASQQFVQYYIFSVNGVPKGDRNEVRVSLGSLFVKHAYFAKIQFAPRPAVQKVGDRLIGVAPTPAQADGAAADFVKHFMPHIVKTLPTAQDVARLDEGGAGKE